MRLTFAALALFAFGCTPHSTFLGTQFDPDAGGFGGGGDEISFGKGGGFGGGGVGGCGAPVDNSIDERLVITPSRQPPPLSGGTLAVMASGTVVVADPDRDLVWILASTETTGHRLDLSLGDEPGRVIEGPLGRAFVSLRGAGAVAEIDVNKHQLVARHPACAAPRGLAWSEKRQVLTVACASGSLARLTFQVGTELTLSSTVLQHPADDLRDVIQRSSDVLVSTFRSARLYSVADDGQATQVGLPTQPNGPSRQVAWRMIDSGGVTLVAHQLETNDPITGLCGATGTSYSSGGVLLSQVTGFATSFVEVGDLVPAGRSAPVPIDLARSSMGQVAIVSAGDNLVVRMNPNRVQLTSIAGNEPTSVAYRGEQLIIFSREPSQLTFVDGELIQVIPLQAESVASSAHDLFHRATPAGIACASCHPEAGDDGHVWNLPEGLRRTNSLRGGLKASAPFHWQGDRADIGEVMADVMVKRMAGRMPSRERSDALINWLDTVPSFPAPDALDANAVARGKAVFEAPAQACATCHTGPLGTNNTNADVGTGAAFQVPRLTGLAARAPYFHDGRVGTLLERFGAAGGGEQHGHTASLTRPQIDDLIQYLQSR